MMLLRSDAFAGKVSLRYDSDTQKVKSLTK